MDIIEGWLINRFIETGGECRCFHWQHGNVGDLHVGSRRVPLLACPAVLDGPSRCPGQPEHLHLDVAGRKTQQIDPLDRCTTASYDDAGRQTLRIDARGNRTTYTFDAKSQLTGRLYPDASRATFAYDTVGNRTKMENGTGTYTYTYDDLNRTRIVINPASKKITYAYDSVSQRDHIIDPDGGRFTYTFDAAGRLDHLVNPQGDRTSYTYDAASRRTLKNLANGTRASFTYDAVDQLTNLYNFKSDNSVISSFDYQYDNAGNRTNVAESSGDRVTWSYDNTYQLKSECRSGASAYNTTFTYDAVGNRLIKEADAALTTSTYDAANQLQTGNDTSGTTTYTFDADGNQQKVKQPDGSLTTNTWDFENRNTKVELPSAVVNTFVYNGDGQRIEKQDSSGTSKFIWDDQNYLLETDVSDTTQVVYTNEPQQYGNLISQRRSSTTSYYHFDALGSTREMTNASETTTDTWIYEAYGDEVARTGTTVNPFRYVGRLGYYFDSDGVTYYVRARTYNPAIARWLSQDPLYYPWVASLANPYTFTGRRYDAELGRFISRDPIGYEIPGPLSEGYVVHDIEREYPLYRSPHQLQTTTTSTINAFFDPDLGLRAELNIDRQSMYAVYKYAQSYLANSMHHEPLYSYGRNNPVIYVDPNALESQPGIHVRPKETNYCQYRYSAVGIEKTPGRGWFSPWWTGIRCIFKTVLSKQDCPNWCGSCPEDGTISYGPPIPLLPGLFTCTPVVWYFYRDCP